MEQLPELAFYGLPGAPRSPADLIPECRDGEALGFGSVFLSERFNIKEAATLSGVAAAASSRLGITTGVTNHNTRHPIVTAGIVRTMQSLTGGRFTLGLGRGIAPMQDAYGIPRITTAQMEDFADIMRRLFRGEVIIGHDGPAGPTGHLGQGKEAAAYGHVDATAAGGDGTDSACPRERHPPCDGLSRPE